jgi:hypothetical protein
MKVSIPLLISVFALSPLSFAESVHNAGNAVEAKQATDLTKSDLPSGRLVALIIHDNTKQAVINHLGDVTRLSEGSTWQGWKVISIEADQLKIRKADREAQLSLWESFLAPKASAFATDATNASSSATTPNTALSFSEAQKQALRENLLVHE